MGGDLQGLAEGRAGDIADDSVQQRESHVLGYVPLPESALAPCRRGQEQGQRVSAGEVGDGVEGFFRQAESEQRMACFRAGQRFEGHRVQQPRLSGRGPPDSVGGVLAGHHRHRGPFRFWQQAMGECAVGSTDAVDVVVEQDRARDCGRPVGLREQVRDRDDAGCVDLDHGVPLGAGECREAPQQGGLPDACRAVHVKDGGGSCGRARVKSAGERGERAGASGEGGCVHHGSLVVLLGTRPPLQQPRSGDRGRAPPWRPCAHLRFCAYMSPRR
ncbi:hypothetical protein [Streptomyces wedmorensis]|uniref:hypothetical protein n=1 Tax=Streptomyces wedmorensis TaxID=43759 RepID=UPI0037AFE587